MATFLKNAGDAAGTGVDPSAAQPGARADHLSADAVSLEVPIKVHGSRVTEIVSGSTPHTEPFEEQTTTMIVFPQGGVLRMSTPVSVGQMLVLTNLRSKQDAICRVVKVRTYSNLAGYVEVEFTSVVPGYWGVNFSPDGLDLPKKAPSAAPVGAAGPSPNVARENSLAASLDPVEGLHVPAIPPKGQDAATQFPKQHGTAPASHESLPTAAPRSTVSKIATAWPEGSLPNVQTAPKAARPDLAIVSSKKSSVESKAAAEKSSLVADVSHSRYVSAEPADWRAQNLTSGLEASPVGQTVDTPRSAPRATFGASVEVTDPSTESNKPRQDWRLIAAGIGLVVVLGAGGFFLLHSRTSGSASATPKAVIASAPPAEPAVSALPTPAVVATTAPAPAKVFKPVPAPAPVIKQTAAETKTETVEASKPSAPVVSDQSPVAAPASRPTQAVRDVTSDLFGTLNAHPVAGRRESESAQADAAPSVDAPPSVPGAGAAPSIPNSATAPPSPFANMRLRSGPAQVAEPRLISSEVPAYPAAAKQTHTEGDVVIDVAIDQNGKVADAQVVSGPQILRQAAIDALRRWKYAPGTLDGQPVPAKLTVRIKFRL